MVKSADAIEGMPDMPAHKHSHLGVYAVVENENKVLLVRKGRGPYRGAWDLPGGKIEWGESPADALHRELEEETGLHIGHAVLSTALSHQTVWTRSDGETEALHHLGLIYTVALQNYDASPKQSSDGEDSDGAVWQAKGTLLALELTPFARAVFGSATSHA